MIKKINPLITVIIPTYNRPKMISRAIKSVLNQTYPHVQVCVYDNNPGTETTKIIKKMMKTDSRVKYYHHKKNIGGISNFNFGLNHVKTPFFSMLCDDDILLPNFCETAINGLEKYPSAMLAISKTIIMNKKGIISRVTLSSWDKEGYYKPTEGFIKCIMSPPFWSSIIFRKEIIKKIGLLDKNIIEVDLDYIFRSVSKYPLIFSKNVTCISLKHDESYCETASLELIYPDFLKICNKLYKDKQIPKETKIKAKVLLKNQFKIMLTSMWLRTTTRRNFRDAHKIISIIKKRYGNSIKLNIMTSILNLIEFSPKLHTSFVWTTKKLRNHMYNTKKLKKKYGHYVKYLKM